MCGSMCRGWGGDVESHCIAQTCPTDYSPWLFKGASTFGVMLGKANQCPHLVESGCVVSLAMSASNVHESQ
eukprot:m.371717 g.371717  ORF g.371717 m.371717 type:complete len:71 (-) comp16684_c2_seq19:708-920(-)